MVDAGLVELLVAAQQRRSSVSGVADWLGGGLVPFRLVGGEVRHVGGDHEEPILSIDVGMECAVDAVYVQLPVDGVGYDGHGTRGWLAPTIAVRTVPGSSGVAVML